MEMIRRPSWDEYFMDLAKVVATRSTCLKRKVGALIVVDKRIVTTGYNGSPSGMGHCGDLGCACDDEGSLVIPKRRWEVCRALHGEMNAILQAAQSCVSIAGGTLYTTASPCTLCAKMVVNTGIHRVVCWEEYEQTAVLFLEKAGVVCWMLNS